MITLIHGNDNLASRNYFLSIKDENSILMDAQNLNLVELSQIINGSGLFLEPKKIFIDNLFTNKGSKNQVDVFSIIGKGHDSEIYLYADKEIPIKSLSDIKDLNSKVFRVPQNIWNFLDEIRPKSSQNIFKFHEVLKETEPEIIFSMILRQFRLLLAISSSSSKNISEVSRLAPWQKSKLTRQASLFSNEKLIDIIKKLYFIDKTTKTGKTSLSLKQNIDILLLEI